MLSSDLLKYIKKDSVLAIIPARGGSKGVPGKNIRKLQGYPLISYSVMASNLAKKIERTIISTDSAEISEIAKIYGAEIPFLRPAEYASDTSSDLDFMQHAIKWLADNEKCIPEYIVHLRPTTPLRDPNIIDKAVEVIIGDEESTSLRSGHKCPESPFKWFLKDKEGHFNSLSNDITQDQANNARQMFSDVYVPDGYVDVVKTEHIIKTNTLHGNKIIGFESPFCYEVDGEEDFEILEYQLIKKQNALFDFLSQNY